MSKENEVICVNLDYDAPNDMLIWTLNYMHNNSTINYASPAQSFLDAVGIKSKVNSDDWKLFCQKMKGKKMNFVLPKDEKK